MWRRWRPVLTATGNHLMRWAVRLVAAVGGTTTLAVFVFVLAGSLGFFREVGFVRMLTDTSWHPSDGQYSTVAVLTGSLFITLGAIAVAAPIGVASAIFSQFY